MPTLGLPELIIVLVIVIIIFGVGRLGDIGGALGKGIKEFRSATRDEGESDKDKEAEKAGEAKKG